MDDVRKLAFAGCITYDVEIIRKTADRLHALPVFAIYSKPKDFPNNVIVRLMYCSGGNDFTLITMDNAAVAVDTVAEARKIIPVAQMGLTVMPRCKRDTLSLVETWL